MPGLPGDERLEPARRQAPGRGATRTRSCARSASATMSTPTSARGSGTVGRSGSRSRSSAERRRARASTFEYASESDKGPYPIPRGVKIEGGPNADGDRHALLARQGQLQALRALRALPEGRRRLARRLGRDLRPAHEQAAPGRLDVGGRGRAARSSRASPATTRSSAAGSTTRSASRSRARGARTSTPPATSRATSPIPRCRRWACGCA